MVTANHYTNYWCEQHLAEYLNHPLSLFLSVLQSQLTGDDTATKRQELQFQGVALCHHLVEGKEAWIKDQSVMVDFLKKIWVSNTYHIKLASVSVYIHVHVYAHVHLYVYMYTVWCLFLK